MERAISHFKARPSAARADTLARLLRTHAANDDQGSRILALLLQPNIVTRETYPTGEVVTIGMEHSFTPDYKGMLWQEETIAINGRPGSSNRRVRMFDDQTPHLETVGVYGQPGNYSVKIRIQSALGIERASTTAAITRRLRNVFPRLAEHSTLWSPARTYECDFTVTTQIRVVAKDEAEQVRLASSPAIDQAMRAAFSSQPCSTMTTFSTSSGQRWTRGLRQITYKDLPAAVAFEAILRLSDGRELTGVDAGPEKFIARAGGSGFFAICPSDVHLEQPGRYEATLVLKPIPDFAYRDPGIKAVWSGALELPIIFDITDTPPPGWPTP